jgi:hypothetical protein
MCVAGSSDAGTEEFFDVFFARLRPARFVFSPLRLKKTRCFPEDDRLFLFCPWKKAGHGMDGVCVLSFRHVASGEICTM